MNDCIVLTLSGSVPDNGNLRKIGECRINVSSVASPDYGTSGTQRLIIKSSKGQTITCTGSGSFTDGSGTPTVTQYTLSANTQHTLVLKNGDFQISIPDKYSLTFLRLYSSLSINIDELYLSTGLTSLQTNSAKTTGNLKALKNLPLTLLELSGSSVNGDIANLPASLTTLYIACKDVFGDVASLGKCTSIETIMASDSNISGRLEDLADALLQNGKTSGTVSCNFIRSNVTYNNEPCRTNTITFSGGSYVIS